MANFACASHISFSPNANSAHLVLVDSESGDFAGMLARAAHFVGNF